MDIIRIANEANMTVEQVKKLLEALNKDPAHKEKIHLRYGVDLVVRRKDGSIKQELHLGNIQDGVKRERSDTIHNAGLVAVAGLILLDIAEDDFDWLAIGTGAVAVDVTDTTLGTETHREAGTGTLDTTAIANDTAKLIATFSGYGGSEAVTEIGMFNLAVAGDMLMRQVHDPLNIDWAAGDSYEATVKIQCARA